MVHRLIQNFQIGPPKIFGSPFKEIISSANSLFGQELKNKDCIVKK